MFRNERIIAKFCLFTESHKKSTETTAFRTNFSTFSIACSALPVHETLTVFIRLAKWGAESVALSPNPVSLLRT